MRLTDLLVDLAAVASASRSVASKHIALRARQVERYGKGSSVVGSVLRGQQQQQQQQQEESEKEAEREETVNVAEQRDGGDVASVEQAQVSPVVEGGEVQSARDAVEPAVKAGVEGAPESSGERKPEFTPAPWADGAIGALKQGFVPPRAPPSRIHGRKPVGVPLGGGRAVGVDLNIFRTSRGSSILEALKEIEEKEHEEKSFIAPVSTDGEKVAEKSASAVEVSEGSEERAAMKLYADVPEPKPTPSPAKEDVSGTPEITSIPEVAAAPAVETTANPKEMLSQEDASLLADLTTSTPISSGAAAYELRESRVPSSRIGRLWNYGGLAAGMFAGAIGEGLSRAVGGGGSGSMMLSAANMERLVSKLSRMRGAALKLGQMMSFQDAKMLPAPIQEVLQRVQDRADYMPAWQRDRVLSANLAADWRNLFDEFEEKPIAAASIGQVHRATLKSNGARVAVKIQFPGVADSINSDLDNLAILLAATKLLPKGLYLNKTIDNARTELAWECDYAREAECAERYRQLLTSPDGKEDDVFSVPRIYREASGKHVLTMEFMDGVGVTRIKSFSQEQRDWIGTQILRLCLREITEFRFMQTDPNWTNFLYNASRDRLELLDFGASREYPDEFVTLYVRLLEAASRSDRAQVKALSEELGYLTGHESKAMLDAHITSVLTLAEPFLQSAPEVYDFRDQTITERVKAQIPVMIHERLAPPPEETYSLHRKLSGAFLLCARLGSQVRCRELFEDALEKTGYRKR
ncbi:hypothetical protein MFIFM68171_05114 [Madurella fahalii]|uniref:ABC1 atypical kinase-like domain-containing protein n=1 Tax=Madurella fahalii TaxID=1157608 RepID=A0ABQ0GAX2_9PEZI